MPNVDLEIGFLILSVIGGIVSVHVRLARIETKLEPLWTWYNEQIALRKGPSPRAFDD